MQSEMRNSVSGMLQKCANNAVEYVSSRKNEVRQMTLQLRYVS
jgi:hypothetical protein